MRGAGDTRRPMVVSVALNALSLILNMVFSLGLGMGVRGAALSYLLSVAAAAAASLAMVLRTGFAFRPSMDRGDFSWRALERIAAIAFPSAVENLMFNGSRIIIQIFLAGMGAAMISANSVFNSVNGILNVPCMALYYLTVPVVSRYAGDRKQAAGALRYMARKTQIWSIPVALGHLVLGYPLSYLFSRDPEVLYIAAGMLAAYAVFAAMQHGSFILPNGFKAVGDANFAMVISSLTAWIIRVGGTWLLGVRFGWGAYAIALTQGLDSAFRALVYYARYKSGTWLRHLPENNG